MHKVDWARDAVDTLLRRLSSKAGFNITKEEINLARPRKNTLNDGQLTAIAKNGMSELERSGGRAQ